MVCRDEHHSIFRNAINHFEECMNLNVLLSWNYVAGIRKANNFKCRIKRNRLNRAIEYMARNSEPIHHVTYEWGEKCFDCTQRMLEFCSIHRYYVSVSADQLACFQILFVRSRLRACAMYHLQASITPNKN